MLRALHIANCCTLTYPAVECPPLDSPTDGSFTQTGKFYGDSATYTCNPGFSLNGKETLNCQADGTWDGDPPTCFKCKMTYTLTETVSIYHSLLTAELAFLDILVYKYIDHKLHIKMISYPCRSK